MTTMANAHENSRSNGTHDENGVPDPLAHAADGQEVSEARYWADYYERGDVSYEWHNGRLEVMPMTDYVQYRLYLWFLSLVKDFLHVYPLGRMVGLELGFRMNLPTGVSIRKPDLAVVLDTNPVPLADHDRSYKGIFDLCIESISDSKESEIERDTVIKRQEYAAAGVQEYYILDERRRETVFYRLNTAGVYVPIQPVNGVIQSRLLPRFQFRLADLYSLPEPPQLVADPVYNHYTSPYLRAERERAEEAIQRADRATQHAARATQQAEAERNLAAQERARSEKYAALLRSMGVDPDAP